jgi:hypothetical protein
MLPEIGTAPVIANVGTGPAEQVMAHRCGCDADAMRGRVRRDATRCAERAPVCRDTHDPGAAAQRRDGLSAPGRRTE